ADGATFTLQNAAQNALGGGGGGLGYDGIKTSVAIALNIYNGHTIGTTLYTAGKTTGNYASVPFVNSGDPINVVLNYDGTILKETLTDAVTNLTYSTWYAVDIPTT